MVLGFVLALAMVGGRAYADSGSASFRYLVASGPLCGLASDACPAVAVADNGDTVAISGAGTLSIHPKSVTGTGTFVHKAAAGATIASGTWTATDLISFQDAGTSPEFPSDFHAGTALILVHLTVTAGPAAGAQADAVLRVTCELPPTFVPGNRDEGVRLAVGDLINFNHEVSGFTLFISLP